MPEQLTKHPEVTLQVLKSSAGARCGEGARQEILTTCPAERFCKLPGGELCVYGLNEAGKMTQIGPAEWRAVLGSLAPAPPAPEPAASGQESLFLGGALLLGGVALGAVLARWRARRG